MACSLPKFWIYGPQKLHLQHSGVNTIWCSWSIIQFHLGNRRKAVTMMVAPVFLLWYLLMYKSTLSVSRPPLSHHFRGNQMKFTPMEISQSINLSKYGIYSNMVDCKLKGSMPKHSNWHFLCFFYFCSKVADFLHVTQHYYKNKGIFFGWFVFYLQELIYAKSFIFRGGIVWLCIPRYWVANSITVHWPSSLKRDENSTMVKVHILSIRWVLRLAR